MTRSTPVEERSHRRLFAVVSLVLVLVTVWSIVDEVHTRRPWKQHQSAWLAASGEAGGPRVHQLVVPALNAVDRCITCHAGVQAPAPVAPDLPPVLAPHSEFESLIGNHPPERFGCVSCHRGQGLALTEETAHASERGYWPDPMLPGSYAQATCLACHPDDDELDGAPLLSKGRRLFMELGCNDCHLAGADMPRSPQKRGPSLRHVASKLQPGALLEQIRRPVERRQGFRMPRFWPGADEDPAMAARRDEESLAIAAFLLSASQPWQDRVGEGDVSEGQRLFDSIGCRGCHVLGTDGADDVVVDDSAPEERTGADDAWGSFGGDGDGGGDAWGSFGGEEEEPPPAPEEPVETLGQGPALGSIGARVRPGFLIPWLVDPPSYSPDTTMPSLRLDEQEAGHLAAWLSTLGSSEAPAAPPELSGTLDPKLVARGQDLVADYGCFGCHDVPGFEEEGRSGADLSEYGRKKRQQMHFGPAELPPGESPWDTYTSIKLSEPRAFESEDIPQLMPAYAWNDGEIEALTVYLRGLRGDRPPEGYIHVPSEPDPVRHGRALATELNCVGCHTLDNVEGGIRRHYAGEHQMPPILDGEGERVRPDWLYGFLLEPALLRPWLQVRMPTFGFEPAEAEALVAWMGARDGQTSKFRPTSSRALSAERATLAADMFVDLKCVTCHSGATAGVKAGDLAPDLGLARQRLDRSWVTQFLKDPGAMLAGTRMPQFFPDGQSPFPDLLGGESDAQIELLVDHLMNLGLQSASPPPMVESGGDEHGVPDEQ